MKQAIIFDMDGVLIQSEKYYYNRRMRFFSKLGIDPDTRDFNAFLGASDEHIWELLVHDPVQRKKLLSEYNRYRLSHEIHYPEYLTLGVVDILGKLRAMGLQIALASAGEPKEIRRMLQECSLEQFFDLVVSGETVKHNKPDPEVYFETLHKLDLPAAQCVAIEDSVNGIAAAKAAGLDTWALKPNSYEVDQSGADIVLNSLSDLILKLKK